MCGKAFFISNNSTMLGNNGAVLNIPKIIKSVMISAAEAEIGAMFINVQEAVSQWMMLIEMGHPQPQAPIQTENYVALSVVTNNVQPQRTKAMDMRFHWLRCRDAQGQLRYYWRPVTETLGNYWTKNQPSAHHKSIQSTLLTPLKEVIELRENKLVRPMCHLQNLKNINRIRRS